MKTISTMMTPEEKGKYASELSKIIHKRVVKFMHANEKLYRSFLKYPHFVTKECDLGDAKTWIVVMCILKRPSKTKYEITWDAYYPYVITNAKNPDNNGLGLFNITSFYGCDYRMNEISPHCINRFMQRGNSGLIDGSVGNLCEFFSRQKSDYSYHIGTGRSHVHRGVTLTDFIINIADGQILGWETADKTYTCFKTFISKNEMKASQFAQNEIMEKMAYADWHDSEIEGLIEEPEEYVERLFDGNDMQIRHAKIWNKYEPESRRSAF